MPRRAFTLVELVVVVAVVGVLVGVLLPAVQKVRAAAARTQSLNNLKQLALATHAFESARRHLPGMGLTSGTPTDANFSFSVHAQVLPFVEQEAVGTRLRFDRPLVVGSGPGVFYFDGQFDAVTVPVKTFLDPADREGQATAFPAAFYGGGPAPAAAPTVAGSKTRDGILGTTSYVVCKGSGTGTHYDARYPTDGLFWVGSRVRLADVPDGASNTAMWASCLIGTNTPTPNPDPARLRNPVNVSAGNSPTCGGGGRPGLCKSGGQPFQNPALTVDPAAAASGAGEPLVNGPVAYQGARGGSWARGQTFTGMFDTYQPPNSPSPDYYGHGVGWFAARSASPDGAPAAMADGSARFVPAAVHPAVWRAAGSRNGGEPRNPD